MGLVADDLLGINKTKGSYAVMNMDGSPQCLAVDLEKLTRREGFPEEVLASSFALAGCQHGAGGPLQLVAHVFTLSSARDIF